jgi:hypothetical protein
MTVAAPARKRLAEAITCVFWIKTVRPCMAVTLQRGDRIGHQVNGTLVLGLRVTRHGIRLLLFPRNYVATTDRQRER